MTLVKFNRDTYPSFNSLFDDFFNTELGDWSRQNYSASNTTLPKVNIREDENGFEVEMAAPGMEKGDFNVELDNNLLTISSGRKEKTKESEGNYSRREFSYQAFQRSFTLPEYANGDKIGATYKNGILIVSIPKKEEAKPLPPKTIRIS